MAYKFLQCVDISLLAECGFIISCCVWMYYFLHGLWRHINFMGIMLKYHFLKKLCGHITYYSDYVDTSFRVSTITNAHIFLLTAFCVNIHIPALSFSQQIVWMEMLFNFSAISPLARECGMWCPPDPRIPLCHARCLATMMPGVMPQCQESQWQSLSTWQGSRH